MVRGGRRQKHVFVTNLLEFAIAVMEMRRQRSETGEEVLGLTLSEDTLLTDADFDRVLSELVGRGSIVLEADDENDPDYRPEEGEGDEEDEEDGEDREGEDMEDEDEAQELVDEDDDFGYGWSEPFGPHGKWHDDVTEPKPEGLSLLYSGEFGRIGHQTKSRNKDANVARFLLNRGTKLRPVPREDFATVCIILRAYVATFNIPTGSCPQLKWYRCRKLHIQCICRTVLIRYPTFLCMLGLALMT